MPPLTEEQRRALQGRLGQPMARPAAAPSGLPPEVQAIMSGVPPAQPYLKSFSPTSGPSMGYGMPTEEMRRRLTMKAAEQKLRSLTPQASEVIKRDFARIDAFEGMLSDMETLSKQVRKGPVEGRYVKYGSKLTGGDKFRGVSETESINAVTYDDLRPGIAAGLYRAITGDDRISDRDAAQRAMPFVPDIALQDKAFEKRMRIVKRAIQRKRQSIRRSLKLGASSPGAQEGEDTSSVFYGVMGDVLDDELND